MLCHRRRRAVYRTLGLATCLLTACSVGGGAPLPAAPPARPAVTLATTPRIRDSGLLDPLLAEFGRETGYTIQARVVTAAAALRLGEQGDIDALLVDSPAAEAAFVQSGAGRDRRLI